jgi:hypothetical protein
MLELVAKDLALIGDLASEVGARTDQVSTNRRIVEESLREGYGSRDLSAIAELLRRRPHPSNSGSRGMAAVRWPSNVVRGPSSGDEAGARGQAGAPTNRVPPATMRSISPRKKWAISAHAAWLSGPPSDAGRSG